MILSHVQRPQHGASTSSTSICVERPRTTEADFSRELRVQSIVDVGARDGGVEPHIPELQAVEGVAAYRGTNTHNNDTVRMCQQGVYRGALVLMERTSFTFEVSSPNHPSGRCSYVERIETISNFKASAFRSPFSRAVERVKRLRTTIGSSYPVYG